jgi:hypothetical protein
MDKKKKYASTIIDHFTPYDWKKDHRFYQMVTQRAYQQRRTKQIEKYPDSVLSADEKNPFGGATHLFVRCIQHDGKFYCTRVKLGRYSNSYWSILKHKHVDAVPCEEWRNDAGFQFVCYMRLHVPSHPQAQAVHETELVPDPFSAAPSKSDFVWTWDYRECSSPSLS